MRWKNGCGSSRNAGRNGLYSGDAVPAIEAGAPAGAGAAEGADDAGKLCEAMNVLSSRDRRGSRRGTRRERPGQGAAREVGGERADGGVVPEQRGLEVDVELRRDL